MSDGPWKSLPLRRHWKQVAKHAETRAFSPAELVEPLETALRREARELPLDALRRAVAPGAQGLLFGHDMDAELDGILRDHPGVNVVHTFVACLRNEPANGSSGKEVLRSALVGTLDECARDHSRAIAEHYFRKCRGTMIPVDRRLQDAQRSCDIEALASRLLGPSGQSASHLRAKRSGLDDGPLL